MGIVDKNYLFIPDPSRFPDDSDHIYKCIVRSFRPEANTLLSHLYKCIKIIQTVSSYVVKSFRPYIQMYQDHADLKLICC